MYASARARATLFLWFVIAGLVTWAYFPGLTGGFEFDDDANIVRNPELKPTTLSADSLWRSSLSGFSGPLGRPVSMLSFAVQVAIGGLDPFPLKVVNLLIHGLVGAAVYLLSCALVTRLRAIQSIHLPVHIVALIVTAVWLLHPLHVTAVSYIVQRMTLLSSLFTALAVWIYVAERNHQQNSAGRWLTATPTIAALALLAVLSKETGLLLPVYFSLIELFLFQFKARRRVDELSVRGLHGAFALGAVVIGGYILFSHPDLVIGGYEGRPFTMTERLMTESRALIWYLSMIVVPDISQMTLYHDAFPISKSLLSPPSTLVSLLLLASLVVLGWRARRKAPWFGLGIFWFLGGHALESTFLPLELVYEHRNYLPAFGVILACIAGVDRLVARMTPVKQRVLAVGAIATIALLGWTTYTRAYIWSGEPGAFLMDAEHHPESPRANMAAGTRYAGLALAATEKEERHKLRALGERYYRRVADLVPDSANGLLAILLMYYEQQMSPPQDVLNEVIRRLSAGRIDASTVNGLQGITDCKIENVCTFSDEYYLKIMDAAFQNPRVFDPYASNILRCLAKYYSQVRLDHEMAIMLTKRAIELNPRQINIRLELIADLMRGGYLGTALDELDALENADDLKKYNGTIVAWREAINSAIESAPKAN